MRLFARAMFIIGLASFLVVVALSLLGAGDYFQDKALPSGIALLLLGVSIVTIAIGTLSIAISRVKALWRHTRSAN